MKIKVNKNILAENDRIAEKNRAFLKKEGVFAVNLISSPGSGKTTFIESLIKHSKNKKIGVIEGDIATSRDADRIKRIGARAFQINTNSSCHLNSEMIRKAILQFPLEGLDILIIENVGNLVCPSNFDLGEDCKVVMISVTEGDDKPKKYPSIFSSSSVCIINKTDLLPYLECSLENLKQDALLVNHELRFFEVSAKTGEGVNDFLNWLTETASVKHGEKSS